MTADSTPAVRTVAAFDFDGTLTRRDTLLPFLVRAAGPLAVARAVARDAGGFVAVARGRGDRDALKERVLTRTLAGMPRADIVATGRSYGEHLAVHGVTPEMREQVAWHRDEGHEIVIVSASLDVYLEPVASALSATALLASRLEVDERERCTGRLDGGNCRGPEKARRILEYLGTDRAEVVVWAYGDSHGDHDMLALADHPRRVKRGRLTTA